MKTENPALVGVHAFEAAGLGKAPFRFAGMRENWHGQGEARKPGGCCKYCGQGILFECLIKAADGKQFVVGSDCVAKVGDAGLLKAYKQSPSVRAIAKQKRQIKAAAVLAELKALFEANKDALAKLTVTLPWGKTRTLAEDFQWQIQACGAAGRARALKELKNWVLKKEEGKW